MAQIDLDCGGNPCGFSGSTDNVNINSATNGTIDGLNITFSSTDSSAITYQGSGQASLGETDGLINNLTFTIESGYGFELADFNLRDPLSSDTHPATSLSSLTITTVDGTSTTFNIDNLNGVNRFGVDTSSLGPIASVTLNSTGGFGTFTQLRLGDITNLQTGGGVPEPATWAMMLMGFGATGIAMRRSRRKKALLAQIA
jgi:hypothetical protein